MEVIGRPATPEGCPELAVLAAVGRDVLTTFPVIPGACMMMSALYVGGLRRRGYADARLVAGMLTIEGVPIFGSQRARHAFPRTEMDWDGHAWVALGGFVADASILRTGRSKEAPRRLRRFVETRFTPSQGLYIATPQAAREDGLDYIEQGVLDADAVDAIYRGALTFLKP